MPIRVLPPAVADRIAAGEVVERPASIVKELVENALDAGATSLTVEITGGGVEMIRVTDDGCGIPEDELDTAFERHATSKLTDDAGLATIETLGFRGEALPSIAAVADIEIASRPHSAESASFRRIEAGEVVERIPRGSPPGTAITARGVFARLPARQAFLRTPGAEASAIATVVSRYALARPETRFRLVVDGRQSFQTPGSDVLRDAVAAVLGLDLAAALLEVHPGEGPIAVTGLVGPPQVSRGGRSHISLFVNRRWIQNRRLVFAIEQAYSGLLMVGRHPVAVLSIEISPAEVDVNVHPTKAEVRFRDESAVFSAVQRAVRAAIAETAPVPVATGVGFAGEPSLTLSSPAWTPPLWEAGVRLENDQSKRLPSEPPAGETAPTPLQALPVLRVIGQFGNIYIIAEGPEGMYLIDQHAAHERVLYEQFALARLQATPRVQGLLDPLTLDLSVQQRGAIAQETERLAAHGFEIEPFGDSAIIIRAFPVSLAAGDVRENIARFLEHLLEEGPDDNRDRVAMSLACHGAIRAGKALALDEMRELIRQLEASESPNTCPHGRPTMVHVSADMLAKGFGRR